MSFYNDASLVVIPSGYKTSKVYAEKPTDGSGDLAFTRTGDTATRVASNGLIERVRTNLVLQSETFNTTWSASRGAVTANATTAPNGTTTADKFVADTQVNPHFISQSIASLTNGGIYTSSVYAKAGEWNSIAIFRFDSAIGVSFRLDTQAMTVLAGSPVTYSITDAGNGWYRCSVSFAIASTSDGAQFRVGNNGAYSIAGNNADGLFLWGAQYEATDFGATPYIPTLTAAVSTGPVANVPRLDYLGSTCPRLLLEPQRTNLVFFSEQLNNAGWAASAVVTANTAVSPDGYTNADSVMEVGINEYQILGDPVTTVSGTAYTFSFFAKPNGRNFARILFGNGSFPNNQSAYFNLLTGATSATASVTASMVSYGNGWYRCIATCTSDANVTDAAYFGPARNMTDGYATYVGNASVGIYAWGVQQEAGAYATSYIPTLAASATRGADACSKQNIAGTLPTAYPFTLYAEGFLRENNEVLLSINDYTLSDVYYQIGATTAGFFGAARNGAQSTVLTSSGRTTGTHKLAAVFTSSQIRLFANGALIATAANVQTFNTNANDVLIGQLRVNGDLGLRSSVNQALVFKSALSDAQCIQITTL